MASENQAESSTWQPPPDHMADQHDGTTHLAVHNTFLRRWLVLLALRTTGRLSKRLGCCTPISRDLIVKRGPFVHLTEAATLQFIASQTSIPVPRVWCAFVHKNIAHIVMDRIPGSSLWAVWNSLSPDELAAILAQLRGLLNELRALKPRLPGMAVESCVGGSLTDSRIPHANPRFGPFASIQEFHAWLRQDVQSKDKPDGMEAAEWEAFRDMMSRHEGDWPQTVFTHGDLNPSNIFVKDGRITGIIDWEFAGWYPHYWEYTSAWYGNRLWPEYQGMIKDFLDPCPDELGMEITRQKYWGDF